MKQLRYFTRHSNALDEVISTLAKMGVRKNNVHIFEKQNNAHRFDGLVLESNHKEENHLTEVSLCSIGLLGLFGSGAIFLTWFSFTGFALTCVLAYSGFALTYRFIRRYIVKKPGQLVYFLVIEVDEKLAGQIKSSLKGKYEFVRA